jgi:hypothetical protein
LNALYKEIKKKKKKKLDGNIPIIPQFWFSLMCISSPWRDRDCRISKTVHKYMTAVQRVALKEELHKCFKY